MLTSPRDRNHFRFGTAVRIKSGVMRKPWEWIGIVEIVSGNMASVAWRVTLPGMNGKRPVTLRRLDDLEILEEEILVDATRSPQFA